MIATQLGVASDQLVFGNGSDETIGMIVAAFAEPRVAREHGSVGRAHPAAILYPTPTFVYYRLAAIARGVEPIEVPLAARFELDEAAVERAIETVGSERVLAQAYEATRRGGTTVTVGLPHPERMLTIPAVGLVAEERTLRGSYLGSCVPNRDLPRFVALHEAGRLPVDRLLTHRIALDEINEGFDRLASGEAVRQAVVF